MVLFIVYFFFTLLSFKFIHMVYVNSCDELGVRCQE